MSAAGDQPVEDYDDGPRGPESVPRPADATKSARRALRISVVLGIISGLVLVCSGWMMHSDKYLREDRERIMSSNNLKMIAIAIHNYHDTLDQYPHNTYTADGKPLLSWRVYLLPYMEYDYLFKQFVLDEPWDGPNNSKLLGKMPPTFARAADRYSPSPFTYYRGFASRGAVFERRPEHVGPRFFPLLGYHWVSGRGLRLQDFTDGADSTILVVEAGDPVEWTKPDDLDASPGKSFPKMGGLGWRKVFQAAFADGSVRPLKLDTPEETLRALVTHSGGEALPADWNED